MPPTVPPAPGLPDPVLAHRPYISPQLVVRVKKGYERIKADSLYDAGSARELPGIAGVLADFGSPPHARALTRLTASEVDSLEREAAVRRRWPDYAGLTRYWRIDVRGIPDTAAALRDKLASLTDEVDRVYFEMSVRAATFVTPDDDLYGATPAAPSGDPGEYQKYLEAWPVGVNARAAWLVTDGSGVGFADLEQEWYDDHEDLNLPAVGATPEVLMRDAIPLVAGVNRMSSRRADGFPGFHGTATLGIVLARDNARGCIGLAPNARDPVRLSYWEIDPKTLEYVEQPISDLILVAARDHLSAGDVLLLEVEKYDNVTHYPVEINSLDRDTIKLVVSLGIVVIEPAGNGSNNLANFRDPALPADHDIFVRGSQHEDDSGALMVAASTVQPAANPNDLHSAVGTNSNFGTRVDCFAWGDHVRTCGSPTYPQNRAGYDLFADTSAAAAILAGVAILVQSAVRTASGSPLSPMQLRELLSEPALGLDRTALGMGVMPDLGRVLGSTGLGLLPDIYLRDNLGDTGRTPSVGGISSSPDIIVRQQPEPNPDTAFGGVNAEVGGYGQDVLANHEHTIYVRMKNRGAADATAAQATVYWSPTSTLVSPDLWHEIDTTPPQVVPANDTVVVSEGITWDALDVPGEGHYCFVCVLHDPLDPKPPLWTTMAELLVVWDDFTRMVRDQNNVAWCNFNVIRNPAAFVGEWSWLPVLIPGAFDADREFTIEIFSRLPLGTEMVLEMPRELARHLGLRWKPMADCERVRVYLPHRRRITLGAGTLPKGARNEVRIGINAPKALLKTGGLLAIRQVWEGLEVGRVTWSFPRPT